MYIYIPLEMACKSAVIYFFDGNITFLGTIDCLITNLLLNRRRLKCNERYIPRKSLF